MLTVERDHHVLHLDHNHPRKRVYVHERAHGHLVHNHRIDGFHDLEPCALFRTHPTVLAENGFERCNLFLVGRPGVIDHDRHRFTPVRTDDGRWRD